MADEEGGARRGRKYEQVLEGARAIFVRDGFEGASVDDVAREAQVSKATLYSYFPDKRLLFAEVARDKCRRATERALMLINMADPPDRVLPEAARQLIDFLLSDIGRAIFRIAVAEAERFPDIARQFYDCGHAAVRDALVGYLRGAAARGEVKIDDFNLAADQFAELCKAQIVLPVALGIMSDVAPADRERIGVAAVETFLARYGA